jgi:hypothetical protein
VQEIAACHPIAESGRAVSVQSEHRLPLACALATDLTLTDAFTDDNQKELAQ